MARKNLGRSINTLRKKGQSIFRLPRNIPNFAGGNSLNPLKVRPMVIKARGLKPNTKYKVMLDNQAGSAFEDITDTSKPVGKTRKNNTITRIAPAFGGGKPARQFIKTDSKGNLEVRCKPFGTEENTKPAVVVPSPGVIVCKPPTHGKLWKYWHGRVRANDFGRDRIKLIQYSAIQNPDASDRVKTLKKEISTETVRPGKPTSRPKKAPEYYLPPAVICDVPPKPEGEIIKKVQEKVITDYYQTFYIDADVVDGSDTVDLLDVSLYIRSKPQFKANASGAEGPGINICLIDCEVDGTPIIDSKYADSVVDLDYHAIKASPLATSETVFKFPSPVTVRTNAHYAIAVFLEDQGYILWDNRKGDLTIVDGQKTEERSQGSSKGHKGDVYFYNDEAVQGKKGKPQWVPKNDLDLKFDVHIAEYSVSDVTVKLVNKPYEFFNLSSVSGTDWDPGELVYKQQASNRPGTVSVVAGAQKITGDASTDFTDLTDGQKIVLIDSTDNSIRDIFTVDRSVSGTANTLYVDEIAEIDITGNYQVTVVAEVEYFDYYFNSIRLENSSVNYTQYTNANSALSNTLIFAVGDTIRGVDSGMTAVIDSYNPLPVSTFRADMNATVPPQFKTVTHYNFSYEDSTTPGVYYLADTDKQFFLNAPNHIKGYAGTLLSASQEVDQTHSGMIDNQSRSSEIEITYQYTGANTRCYACPTISLDELEMTTHRWVINNDGTNEHLNEGNAKTRHISSVLDLGPGSDAEDVRLIMNAYKPRGTSIHAYARIQNRDDTENFDNINWTKLKLVGGGDSFSDPTEQFDYVELEFGLDDYTTGTNISGAFTTVSGSAVITGSVGTDVSSVNVDDTIRIYSPLFEDNYQIFNVESKDVGARTITLSEAIANNNIVGEGFKVDIMTAPTAAFKNPDNYGIARYYNSTGEKFDTYSRLQVKLVLLAQNRYLVPKVDDYRVIGVTA